jgi:polyhydroxybutyrate depolymerase
VRTRKSIIALCLVLVAATVTVAGSGAVVNRASAATVRNAGVLPSAGCGSSSVRAGQETITTMAGGAARTYIRRVPATHDGVSPRPLVIDLHGLYQGAALQEQNSDWAPRADRDGMVVVYPQGIDSIWDIGVGSPDVAYFGQLLDETEAALCIDTNRVYVDGFSLGAFLTSAIVCTYADRIAAVAPIAGIYMPSGCTPARPVPALTIHGTLDNWVGYRSIPGNVAAWAARNGCGASPTTAAVPGDAVVNITKFTYDCPESAEVEFYSIENGGHAWPGSEFSRTIEAAVGYTTFAITATDLIWDFFRSHQLHPDIATYTARLSAADGAFLSSIAAASGKSVADLVRIGVDALDAVAETGAPIPTPAAPANNGPFWVTVSWPAAEAARIDAAAAAWGVDGDALHNLGGRLVNRVVFLAAIGRL